MYLIHFEAEFDNSALFIWMIIIIALSMMPRTNQNVFANIMLFRMLSKH